MLVAHIFHFNFTTTGDHVIDIDFDEPFQSIGYVTELTREIKNKNGLEQHHVLKVSKESIPDIRDVNNFKATMMFGGKAILIQDVKIPAYWLQNQKDLAKGESIGRIIDTSQKNAVALAHTMESIRTILLVLPKGYLTYEMVNNEPNFHANRTQDIIVRDSELVVKTTGSPQDKNLHIYYGFYYLLVQDVAEQRMLLVENKKAIKSLEELMKKGNNMF